MDNDIFDNEETESLSSEAVSAPDILTVATMNVLHDETRYLERIAGIATLMRERNVAVVSLQELRNDSIEEVSGLFELMGYSLRYRKEVVHNEEDTVGIAFDASMLTEKNPAKSIYGIEAIRTHLVTRDDSKREVVIVSYHGDWGHLKQQSRLSEVSSLSEYLAKATVPVILGGDFNAVPMERAIRYMRGEEQGVREDDWTYWVEAQDYSSSMKGNRPAASTTISSGMGELSAIPHGINPKYLPERRIDYLFSSGWSYGHFAGFTGRVEEPDGVLLRAGDLTNWVRMEDISDHRALLADIIFSR